jgi:predicted transcriptional regulator
VKLQAVVADERGLPTAGNFCFFEVVESNRGSVAWDETVLALCAGDGEARFSEDPERGEVAGEVHLLAGQGDGSVSYRFELPDDIAADEIEALELLAELSSARPGAPQTSGDRWPSTVRITIGGQEASTVRLPDQPADSRGALSHMFGLHGRYGELTRASITGDAARAAAAEGAVEVVFHAEGAAARRGGLTVYSSRAGRYPCDVTLQFSLNNADR